MLANAENTATSLFKLLDKLNEVCVLSNSSNFYDLADPTSSKIENYFAVQQQTKVDLSIMATGVYLILQEKIYRNVTDANGGIDSYIPTQKSSESKVATRKVGDWKNVMCQPSNLVSHLDRCTNKVSFVHTESCTVFCRVYLYVHSLCTIYWSTGFQY